MFDFHTSIDEMAALVPAGVVTEKLYLGPMTASAVRTATIARFNDGVFLIQYNGHGATTQWAQENLLHVSNASGLTNAGRYPFVFVTNCLSGNFVSGPAAQNSLSELFTQSGEKGAIGFFASTSLNTSWGQHELSRESYRLLWAGQTQTGPLFTMAKARIGATGNHLDIIRAWILIGDPALRQAYPR